MINKGVVNINKWFVDVFKGEVNDGIVVKRLLTLVKVNLRKVLLMIRFSILLKAKSMMVLFMRNL